MKRKSLRTLVCALLASLALTTFAFADNGPKPQLIVRVRRIPSRRGVPVKCPCSGTIPICSKPGGAWAS